MTLRYTYALLALMLMPFAAQSERLSGVYSGKMVNTVNIQKDTEVPYIIFPEKFKRAIKIKQRRRQMRLKFRDSDKRILRGKLNRINKKQWIADRYVWPEGETVEIGFYDCKPNYLLYSVERLHRNKVRHTIFSDNFCEDIGQVTYEYSGVLRKRR